MGLKEIKEKLNYVPFPDQPVFRPGAYNPGLFKLNREKLKKLRPQIFGPLNAMFGNRFNNPSYMSVILNDGDMQTAVVVSLDPLLVACYTDEMDAVVLQYFPAELGQKLGFELGTRLITVNSYNGLGTVRKNKDLYPGPRASGKYKSVGPVIADLYTDDVQRLMNKKAEIPEAWWEHTAELGMRYIEEHPGVARNGLGFQFADAKPIERIKFNTRVRLE